MSFLDVQMSLFTTIVHLSHLFADLFSLSLSPPLFLSLSHAHVTLPYFHSQTKRNARKKKKPFDRPIPHHSIYLFFAELLASHVYL